MPMLLMKTTIIMMMMLWGLPLTLLWFKWALIELAKLRWQIPYMPPATTPGVCSIPSRAYSLLSIIGLECSHIYLCMLDATTAATITWVHLLLLLLLSLWTPTFWKISTVAWVYFHWPPDYHNTPKMSTYGVSSGFLNCFKAFDLYWNIILVLG